MLSSTQIVAAPSCRQDPFGQDDPFGRVKEENSPPQQPESDVVGITYTTIQRIMSQKDPDELLALYSFYAKETVRQRTQQVWCTTQFVCQGLQWGHEKLKRVKKRLISMGLIENVKPKNKDGKFGKPYLRVRYLIQWSCFPTSGETRPQLLSDRNGSALERRTPERLKTSPDGDAGFPAVAKLDNRSKEEKLNSIKPPRNYPSERQFDQFIEEEDLCGIPTYRPELYRDLCLRKWSHWNPELSKWVPIRNWREYITALNRKMLEPF